MRCRRLQPPFISCQTQTEADSDRSSMAVFVKPLGKRAWTALFDEQEASTHEWVSWPCYENKVKAQKVKGQGHTVVKTVTVSFSCNGGWRKGRRFSTDLRPMWCGWCRGRWRRPWSAGRPIAPRWRIRSGEWPGCVDSSWCCSDLCCLRARRTTRAHRTRLTTTCTQVTPKLLFGC